MLEFRYRAPDLYEANIRFDDIFVRFIVRRESPEERFKVNLMENGKEIFSDFADDREQAFDIANEMYDLYINPAVAEEDPFFEEEE